MKLQLDTVNKTIKLEDNVKLSELVKLLEKLLPKGEWKEFILQTQTTITHWSSPIVIEREVYPKWSWDRSPWYYGGASMLSQKNMDLNDSNNPKAELSNYSLKAGVYNIEAQV